MEDELARLSLDDRQTNDLWGRAIDQLSEEHRSNINFSCDKLSTLQNLKLDVEKAQKKCDEKRLHCKRKNGEKVIFRDVLGKVLKWITIFRDVGDLAVQYDPGHAALPWAGVRFLLQIAVNDIEKHDFLVENIELVSRCLCRCQILEKLYLGGGRIATQGFQSAMVRLYGSILVYLSNAKGYFEAKKSARILSSAFRDKAEFENYIGRIMIHYQDVNQDAALISREEDCSRYEEMKSLLEEFDAPMKRIALGIQDIQDKLDKVERTAVLNWISDTVKLPYLKHHKENKREILEGTGRWILEDEVFETWKNDSTSSMLWLHGIPGSGKSKLTSLVVQDALEASQRGDAPRPAFFYCSRDNAEPLRSDPGAIIGSIARQLANLSPSSPLLPPAVRLYKEEEDQGGASGSLDLENAQELIMQLIDLYPITTIIIDALDECTKEGRGIILSFIKSTLEGSSTLVKFFLSSREDGDITFHLERFPNLRISSGKNQKDIETFVKSETRQLIEKGSLLLHSQNKPELESKIVDKVSKDADGMFRWASMQLQNLSTLKTDADILDRLGKLPPSLKELYLEIYEGITSNQGTVAQAIALNLFCFLLEGQWALDARQMITLVHPLTSNGSVQEILEICCNLVVLDETFHIFRFAHLSVREFLESLPEYHWQECHASISANCIKHVKEKEKSGVVSQWKKLPLIRFYPSPKTTFLEYARIWTLSHLEEAGSVLRLDDRYLADVLYFLNLHNIEQFAVNGWYQVRVQPCAGFFPVPRRFAILFNACALRFTEIVECIIESVGNFSFADHADHQIPSTIPVNKKTFVLEVLQKGWDVENITQSIFRSLALHCIRHSNFTTLHQLLDRKLASVSVEMLLKSAISNAAQTSGSHCAYPGVIMSTLLQFGGAELVTAEVFEAAVKGYCLLKPPDSEPMVLQVLLYWRFRVSVGREFVDHCKPWLERHDSCITAFMALIEAEDTKVMPGILEGCMTVHALLQPSLLRRILQKCRGHGVEVTQDIFKMAVVNCDVSATLGLLLDDKSEHIHLNQDILILASQNLAGSSILDSLLQRTKPPLVPEAEITHLVFENMLQYYEFSVVSSHLLNEHPLLSITEDLLVRALKNKRTSNNIGLLLDKIENSPHSKNIITQRVLAAATGSFPRSLEWIFKANPSLAIDESGSLHLLANSKFQENDILRVFDNAIRTDNFTISRSMLKMATRARRLSTLRWLVTQSKFHCHELRNIFRAGLLKDGARHIIANIVRWNRVIDPSEEALRIIQGAWPHAWGEKVSEKERVGSTDLSTTIKRGPDESNISEAAQISDDHASTNACSEVATKSRSVLQENPRELPSSLVGGSLSPSEATTYEKTGLDASNGRLRTKIMSTSSMEVNDPTSPESLDNDSRSMNATDSDEETSSSLGISESEESRSSDREGREGRADAAYVEDPPDTYGEEAWDRADAVRVDSDISSDRD